MKFGIIGSGNMGKIISRKLLDLGHQVVISNSRGVDSLKPLIQELGEGVEAGSVQESAKQSIVFLAIPWASAGEALNGLAPWQERILIDTTNEFVLTPSGGRIADLGDKTASEVIAEFVPGARVIKAFNALLGQHIEEDPQEYRGRRVLFFSGDDASAKQELGQLFNDMGFAPVDLGDLATGGRMQQLRGPLSGLNLLRLPTVMDK
jgi:predicted dinucleotide-binding enzyme